MIILFLFDLLFFQNVESVRFNGYFIKIQNVIAQKVGKYFRKSQLRNKIKCESQSVYLYEHNNAFLTFEDLAYTN
jgi:hypothetical protein